MQYTKKQHYIPQMILKRHTFFHPPMSRPMIYQYDLERDIQRVVNIKDICRVKNLYELYTDDGIIDEKNRNIIEKTFSYYERQWNKVLDKVENYQELTERDIALLYFLFIIQLLRLPIIMEVSKELIKNYSVRLPIIMEVSKELIKNYSEEFNFSDIELKNYSKIASFPIGKFDDTTTFLFISLLKGFIKKKLMFYHSDEVFALNGVSPIKKVGKQDFIFPTSSHTCLCLTDENINERDINITKEEIAYLNYDIIQPLDDETHKNFIYSSVPFSDFEIFWKEVVLDRIQNSFTVKI